MAFYSQQSHGASGERVFAKMSVDPERVKRGRNSKMRAKAYEREVARIIGGKRHPADQGGKEDVEHELWSVQVKSRATVADFILEGLDAARANTENKLGVLALVSRGTRVRYLAVMDLAEFAEYHGYGEDDDE